MCVKKRKKLESSFASLLIQKDGEREKKKERRWRGERGKEEGELAAALGACGVGPFKARSPDARRRNCPPRVTPTPSSLPRVVRVLRVLPLRRPRHLLQKSSNRVATAASMKSHPPRVSSFLLPNLFFSLSPQRSLCSITFPPLSLLHSSSSSRIRKARCYAPEIQSAIEWIYVFRDYVTCAFNLLDNIHTYIHIYFILHNYNIYVYIWQYAHTLYVCIFSHFFLCNKIQNIPGKYIFR